MTTTRYYQINGEFHTYEYWHDHEGYTLDATYNVTYKTTNPWGGAASESGYCDTAGSFDLFDFSFFIHGVVGWKTANELALEGYYLNADDGEEFLVEKDGVVSNAAMITDGTRSWYLIEEEIESGWMTQAEYEASGWQPYTPDESPKGYIVVDSSGSIQHSIDSDDMFIHQIQHSVDVVNFYFTSNGAAETENSELESGVDVTLYNADGTVADDDLYDGSGALTYTQANGNMFEAPIHASDLSDTASIANVTLPTLHSGFYTNARFESIRYYIKGTLSNTGSIYASYFGIGTTWWYFGTITWNDESIGDLSDKIAVNSIDNSSLASQQYFRIIFITSGISGYHPKDTSEITNGQITHYSYIAGTHTITFYMDTDWAHGSDSGRLQLRYLNNFYTFNDLDAFDLVDILDGTLQKVTNTDRYSMYNQSGVNVQLKAICHGDLITFSNGQLYLTPEGDRLALSVQVDEENFEEFTLYMASGNKYPQRGITNSFVGYPGLPGSTSSLFALYTDSGRTTPYVFDPSKRYETGYYSNGNWEAWASLEDMPASTSDTDKSGRQIIKSSSDDSAVLWMFHSNNANYFYDATTTTVRAYNKGLGTDEVMIGYAVNGTSSSTQEIQGDGGSVILHDASGNDLIFDQNDSFEIIGIYSSSGATTSIISNNLQLRIDVNGKLRLHYIYPSSSYYQTIYSVTFKRTRYVSKSSHASLTKVVKWGDAVNVPNGYRVANLKTFVGYAFKSYYGTFTPHTDKIVAYPGKDEYFDNIPGHNLIRYETESAAPPGTSDYDKTYWPLAVPSQGYSLDNSAGPHMQVLDFGAGYQNSHAYWLTRNRFTNGTNAEDVQCGDFSVYLRGDDVTVVNNAINSGYPVRFLWFIYDETAPIHQNAVWWKTPEAFRVPHSLWSFQNGTFSWLGNSEDTSSLAWYYKHDWESFVWSDFIGNYIYINMEWDS